MAKIEKLKIKKRNRIPDFDELKIDLESNETEQLLKN